MPFGGEVYSEDECDCATFIEALSLSQSFVKDYRFVALYFADFLVNDPLWRVLRRMRCNFEDETILCCGRPTCADNAVLSARFTRVSLTL